MARKSVSDQMELFDDGGFRDQGNTKDPVSNNSVPVGSTQEEVRDDIPANLSEGEFVLPADVVRYHGLEKIMGIRDQAKSGLQKMESMGQMGNSDQATMPDGTPFKQMAVGGTVPGINIAGPTTQVTRPSMFAAPAPAQTQPVQVAQPVTVQTPQAPVYASAQTPTSPYTFEQAIGTPFGQQQKSETRMHVNEAGEKLYIPFVNGQPIYPIPAGFKPSEVVKEEDKQEQTTRDVRARSATTEQDSGDDNVGIKSTLVSDIAKASQKGKFGNSLAEVGKFLTAPVMYIAGKAFGDSKPTDGMSDSERIENEQAIEGTTPQEILEANSQKAFQTNIRNSTAMFGAAPTFTFGNEAGNVDIVSNGVFHKNGLAMDANGEATLTEQGTVSYKSAADFARHMSASYTHGWHGSTISKAEYNGTGKYSNTYGGKAMTQVAKDRYDAWATELGYKTGGGVEVASVERDDRFRSGENYSDGKKTTTPTTDYKGPPQGVGLTQLNREKAIQAALKNSKNNRVLDTKTITSPEDPRVGTPNSMIDPSEFASAIKGSGTAVGSLTDPNFGRTTKNFDEFMKRQPKNTRTQAFQNLERNKEMVKARNEMSEGATNIPASYGITDDIYSNFNDNNDDPGADGTSSSSDSSGSSDMGFSTASGGFIQRKNLPKANKKKKMKQGGLASRK